MRPLRWRVLAALCVLAIPLDASARAGDAAEPFDFALIGDFPYFPRDDTFMPNLVRDIRDDRSLRFVIHLGDVHNPRATPCSEALFRARFELLEGLGHPFVLTPGDNDWADCDDDPYDQLEILRRIFFADPTRANGLRSFPVRSQSASAAFGELVENAAWIEGGVVFATLHLILPNPLSMLDPNAEHKQRLVAAGEAWLDDVFAVAKERGARGVFLATQADLWPVSGPPKSLELLNPELLDQARQFDAFKAKLAQHVRAFRRPVVLANGDSHYYRVDKPLADTKLDSLETFTRVEGFGSPYGHWVRVSVDPARFEVFSFRQELVPENLFTLVPPDERDEAGTDPGVPWIRPLVRTLQAIPVALAWVGGASLLVLAVRGVRRLRRR